MLNSHTEYILEYLSDKMLVTTVMFWAAIAIAVTSIVCFVLAPIYSKGKHAGVKILAQIISIIDFVGGIGSILVFVVVSVLSLLTSAGAFADASFSVQETLLAILLTPIRFGMPLDSFASGDLSAGMIILFYGLYFGVAGLLGIIAFVVNSSARGKYNGANGKIRGAAVPQGVPQYNPYQPYGQPNIQQYGQNVPQGYPQQYQQNVPQGYPQQYRQNAQQGYPQQYQQNAQYQSTSGETTVLTPEMLAHPVAPVPVMNSQPVPGYAEPAPEVAQQEAFAEPVPEVAQQEASAEPVPEVAQQEAFTEPVHEAAQQEASAEPVPEVAQQEASTEPVPEVAQQEAFTEPVPEVAQQEASAEPVPEVAQQEAFTEPTNETAQQEMPVKPANETTQPGTPSEPEPAGFCVNCGNALSQGAIFCSNCGYRVNNAPAAFCTGCGAKLPDGALFCTTCGKKRNI